MASEITRDPVRSIRFDSAMGQIFYDADGSGAAAAILFATFFAGTAVTAADFIVF